MGRLVARRKEQPEQIDLTDVASVLAPYDCEADQVFSWQVEETQSA